MDENKHTHTQTNTHIYTHTRTHEVIKSLKEDFIKLFQWFSDNQVKANNDKSHLVSGKYDVTMNASGFKLKTLNEKNYSELKSIKA